MFQTKVVENVRPHILGSKTFSEQHALYQITWKNIVEPYRPQMTMWRMRIACWILKAKNTHSEYIILLAFPLQQWLRERASMLQFTYIACHLCGTCFSLKKLNAFGLYYLKECNVEVSTTCTREH